MSLKLTESLFLLVLSFAVGFCDDTLRNKFGLNPNRTAVVNRVIFDSPSIGYAVLPVDRTAFSINYSAWLYQFDISKIFVLDDIPVDDVPVKIKIVEKNLSDMQDKAVVFVGKIPLNSTQAAKIKLSPEIHLQPKSMYEIRLFMPAHIFVYKENLNLKEIRIQRRLWRSLIITFYQNNIVEKPIVSTAEDNIDKDKQQISHGMVTKLHLKFSKYRKESKTKTEE